MRAAKSYLGFALVTVSGCLWFLACTPFDLSALGWVAAVPMLYAIDRAPRVRTALWWGWWAGMVETAGGFYWLIDTTERFAGFPWIGGALVLVAFCATRAVIFLLFTAAVLAIRRRRRVPMALLAPLVMPACEWLVPQIFPCGQWITQAWHPLVIQIAELTGPYGVTALLMFVNGAIYDAWTTPRTALRRGIAVAVVLGAVVGFGTLRMRDIDARAALAPRLEIGLVQPNFPYSVTGDFSREEILRQLAALQEQSRRLSRAGADLVIWSEGSYPVGLPRDLTADFPAESLAMIRRGFTTPLIVGADTVDPDDENRVWNSAVLFDDGGRVAGRYDKVQLLAFGEYTPGIAWLPWLKDLLPIGASRFQAGLGARVLPYRDREGRPWRLGPLICYEDLLPDVIRQAGALHPDLLVNLTSDSWFGARTEPWEHLALSVFSTVELRVALVRSVNSGPSAMIDPNGRLRVKTYADDPYREPRPADGLLVSVPMMPGGHTLFVAWGNWFPMACALVSLFLIVWSRRVASGAPARIGAPLAGVWLPS